MAEGVEIFIEKEVDPFLVLLLQDFVKTHSEYTEIVSLSHAFIDKGGEERLHDHPVGIPQGATTLLHLPQGKIACVEKEREHVCVIMEFRSDVESCKPIHMNMDSSIYQ